jgi:hypothetical protein
MKAIHGRYFATAGSLSQFADLDKFYANDMKKMDLLKKIIKIKIS